MDSLSTSSSAPLLSAQTSQPLASPRSSARDVWPVDLSAAARILGLTISELVQGFVEPSPQTHDICGVVAKRGENVDFSVRSLAEPCVALLSCASRPGVLDTPDQPKALIQIQGQAIICHVLRQLHVGTANLS